MYTGSVKAAVSFVVCLFFTLFYSFSFFFLNDPATTEIYPLSLHDALPIFLYRERADIGERAPADENVARLLSETPSAAVGAERVASVLREEDADVQLVLLRLKPLEEAADAVPTVLALDDGALLLSREFLKGHVHRNLLLTAEASKLRARPVVLRLRPRLDCALGERELWVRDDEVEVEADCVAEALTGRARAERGVEAEESRLGLRGAGSVVLGLQALAEV